MLQSQIGGDRAGLENDLLVKQFKLAKNAAELEKRHKTRTLNISTHSPLLKDNMTVFLEPGVDVGDTTIRQMKLNVTGERKAANVIATSNLHQLGQRTRWCMGVAGCLVGSRLRSARALLTAHIIAQEINNTSQKGEPIE